MKNPKKTVMVVEDDRDISEVLKILLEENNFKVETVFDGHDVEKISVSKKPDLILLDLWMQGMNGIEIAARLRKNSKTEKIPIVLVSASSDVQKKATEAGVNDFLAKPFEIEELLEKVNKYILKKA
ncbi:response regulator [Candidatus Microgenomates bacterium]|nr:response regulator [Candidatus Microgenomates bacterium]